MTPLVRGEGEPVTVFAHGYGATAADSRAFGSGVAGTRVFYTALAHDGVPVPDFGYPALADQLRAVADEHGAGQAFGASMGAGALCRLLAQTPDRFDRVVFFLPALLDAPRDPLAGGRLARLGELSQAGDHEQVAQFLRSELPADVRDSATARAYARRHAETICRESMHGVAERLTCEPAVDSIVDLEAVTAEALVIGCKDDVAHPVHIAVELADRLPKARLYVFDDPAVIWTAREKLRALVSGGLASAD